MASVNLVRTKMKLSDFLYKIDGFATWLNQLSIAKRHLITGVSNSAKTLVLSEIFNTQHKNLLVICDDLYHAQKLADDLENILGADEVYLYPVEEMLASELATSSPEFRSQRVLALDALCQGKPKIVVTSVAGQKRYLPTPQFWQEHQLHLKIDEEIDLTKVSQMLVQMGYQRQKIVERPGDFALRGAILDVFGLNLTAPVRIELFDTQIDSMRFFDSTDQRSIENITQVDILPASDFIVEASQCQKAAKQITQNARKYEQELSTEKRQSFKNNMEQLIEQVSKNELEPKHLLFANEFFGDVTLFDYLGKDGIVIYDDYSRLLEQEDKLNQLHQEWLTYKIEEQEIYPTLDLGKDLRSVEKKLKQPKIFMSTLQKSLGRMSFVQKIDLKTRPVNQFFGQLPLLKTEATRWQTQKQTVVILLSDEQKLHKFEQTLLDFEIKNQIVKPDELQIEILQLTNASLASGFELVGAHLIVLTENELFNKVTRKQTRKTTLSNAERLKSYTDLKPGDYVVHVNHGIGMFTGMKTLEVEGRHQDYLTVVYQNEAQLFIPVSQLDRVQKYVSSESKVPKINKLGTNDWNKTKQKVAKKIEDIADDLVELYAKREAEKGFAFSPDNSYQREFEDAFAYSETPDQLRSTQEIKKDMQKARPMDRLLVGDVGYGKTEVALRAAFKAIQDGKQVAFLVPTTVLAQQHYETIISRFEGFPVSVGILSRFTSLKQSKETLADLKNGMCDIVVGTHRLLSKDVKFSDLGLLIIDEEQRFGVKHKERLKELKACVDVLTLTATPIPRTLNMSMLGVRDLSVIETPPLNRYPVQTYVLEQNYGVISDAIERELARGGQVFYLHNRVEDIEKVTAHLGQLIPDARIAYIHGKMSEAQLERILYDFIEREYDVLVTTTIIETGVDIPNVNTLIVENADYMGLSQLYQLRGRVGRSNRIAYAYFMYQPDKVLTEVSEKRLEAIKDFTELGSGFKIAMRDLSIRGAGNILGKQQHGFIDSVGYDLYTQMLSQAVARKRGKELPSKTDAELVLPIEAYLPASYIEDARQKIDIYKRIRQFENKDQYYEVQADLLDRFGEYPKEVAMLLELGLLKLHADLALIESIKQNDRQVVITLSKQATEMLTAKHLLEATAKVQFAATLGMKKDQMQIKLTLQPKMTLEQSLEQLQVLVEFLAQQVTQIAQQRKAEKTDEK